MVRLRYAFLLAVALAAIYIGLWPSILSAGALLGIAVTPACVVGIAAPAFAERWRLRGLAFVGGGLLAAELALFAAWLAWTPRRPVVLVVSRPIPARVRVVYGVADGAPRAWWRWGRRLTVPGGGMVHTRYAMDDGWYRSENPHPLRIVVQGPGAPADTVPGHWVAGGTTEASGCRLAYDEYAIGRPEQPDLAAAQTPSGWLDSLDTWGVSCRGGQLYRAAPGSAVRLERTAPACYFGQDGVMTCGIASASGLTNR
jgi:hypothetical protein